MIVLRGASFTPNNGAENSDVFDVELTGDQLAAIDALRTGVRGGPEPSQITGTAGQRRSAEEVDPLPS